MGHPLFFYTLSALMIAGALSVILARHPLYAVLSLVVTLFALSGLFILLGAYFVAVVQILVYAGAILVLFLFVVMLLDMTPEKIFRIRGSTLRWIGTLGGLLFLWKLVGAVRTFVLPTIPGMYPPYSQIEGTTAAIGKMLFTTYALPFEVASLLLFVGIIGAIVLAKKKLS